MMNNGNKSAIVAAVLLVGIVHAGAFMGLLHTGSKPTVMSMQEGGATALTMHRVQLAGVTEETEGNAEDSAAESEEVKEPEVEKPKEEMPPEPPKEEPKPEPPKPEPPKEEPKPEPKPEPKVEAPKQEVIASKERSERRVHQQERREAKREERRQERQHDRRHERKQENRNKPKDASNARSAQTAKAVYSESEVSVLSKPNPGYPRAAKQRRMEGTVHLTVGINASGHAYSVRVAKSSGHPLLDKTAAKAAKGVRLKPYMINGVATPINVNIQYQFVL